ncbi:hypothetical protein F4553_002029 [Allocatelliglobosispora scoriae]|uniref:DUF4878 domain-containing protein n=1 Tax=Allocatelliglobosispora scoriae TaxID=643052 RepID=A0A841BPA9_9ACTN|nr:DUF4878 domain-containing protein [Allocatelliglobosispora scoriae]MBB5868650.1 hypothetical protein [Allocatelliglobosispora scoriae]
MSYSPPPDSFTPPPTAQAPKPKRTLRTVLIIVGIVLVLCCGGLGIGGYLLYRGIDEATGPANDATDAFIDDIEAGAYPQAYARYCDQVQRRISEETFVRTQSARPKITGHEITGTSVSNINGRVSARVTVKATQADGTIFTQTFVLVRPDETWQICE